MKNKIVSQPENGRIFYPVQLENDDLKYLFNTKNKKLILLSTTEDSIILKINSRRYEGIFMLYTSSVFIGYFNYLIKYNMTELIPYYDKIILAKNDSWIHFFTTGYTEDEAKLKNIEFKYVYRFQLCYIADEFAVRYFDEKFNI